MLEKEIWGIVYKEMLSKDEDGEYIYSTEGRKELKSSFDKYLQPEKIVTFQHLRNLKQVTSFLMICKSYTRSTMKISPHSTSVNKFDLMSMKREFFSSLHLIQVIFDIIQELLYIASKLQNAPKNQIFRNCARKALVWGGF